MLQIIGFIISLVVSLLTRPKQTQTSVQPGEVSSESAEIGGSIGILFGSRDIQMTPTTTWYGDIRTVAIKKSSGGKK